MDTFVVVSVCLIRALIFGIFVHHLPLFLVVVCVPVVACGMRKLRPCLSYSRRRDHIIILIPYFCVAQTKGGGYPLLTHAPCAPYATTSCHGYPSQHNHPVVL